MTYHKLGVRGGVFYNILSGDIVLIHRQQVFIFLGSEFQLMITSIVHNFVLRSVHAMQKIRIMLNIFQTVPYCNSVQHGAVYTVSTFSHISEH